MKLIFVTLLLSRLAHAGVELDDKNFLEMNCHSEDKSSGFKFGIHTNELHGVSQIANVEFSGALKEAMEVDPRISKKPLVALSKRTGNSFDFLVRFENGLMWDTELTMKLEYRPEGYVSEIQVNGDSGEYFNESDTYQCAVKNMYGSILLKTEKY